LLELQAWARCSKLTTGDLQRALVEEKSLMRTWTMRGTLHVLSPGQYALFVEGFGRHWEPGGAWFRAFEITADEYSGLLEGIEKVLDAKVLSRAELTAALSRRLGAHLADRLGSGNGASRVAPELSSPIRPEADAAGERCVRRASARSDRAGGKGQAHEAGWVSPTELADGVAAGTWEHRVEGQVLRTTVKRFDRLSPGQRDGIDEEAQRLAAYFDRLLALTWE